jgi:HEAT repeat protein
MRDQVFISYSHKDAKWLDMLKTVLQPLIREKEISVWDDKKIKTGQEWRVEIKAALTKAKVAVLLVSPAFLASDFIAKHELPPLLKAVEDEGVTILWIAVRSSLYQETELERYQAANDPSKPLNSLTSSQRDRELVNICKNIKLAVSSSNNTTFPLANQEQQEESKEIQKLRIEYFKSIKLEYEYMDLGGISPRVGNKVVKIKMKDLFIPLQVTEDVSLFESFPEDVIEKDVDIVEIFEDESDVPSETDRTEFSINSPAEMDTYPLPHQYSGSKPIDIKRLLDKPRVVVLGHPGSGKTTIGKYIAYSIASSIQSITKAFLQYIPIIIKAADYASALNENNELSFYQYVTQKHTNKYVDLFIWALQNGRSFVIVDGLDEVPEPKNRITTSKRIDKFVSEFGNNRFLITSRIVGYRQNQLSGDFAHVTLSDLNDEQIQRFLEQWYKAIENEADSQIAGEDIKHRASNLWAAINSNPGIRKLAGNPLLLTIIALASWRGTKLPSRRVELYQIATETLIENWPLKQRGLSIDSNEILSILEPIACRIFSSGKNNLITEYLLRPLFEAQVCEIRGASSTEAKALSREILQTIEEHTGFFLLKGLDQRGQNVYGFLHLTFAEYLTARFLAEQWAGKELDLRQYAHNPQWHEVMLLMAGHIGTWATTQATNFVKDLLSLNSQFEEHLHRDLFLAAEILSDNVRTKRELQNEVVSKLISIALLTTSERLFTTISFRLRAISKVFELGSPISELYFKEHDGSEIRRRKAALLTIVGKETDESNRTLLNAMYEVEAQDEGSEFLHTTLFSSSWSLFERNEDGNAPFLLIHTAKDYFVNFRTSEKTAQKLKGLTKEVFDAATLHGDISSIKDRNFQLWLIDLRSLILDAEKLISYINDADWRMRLVLLEAAAATQSDSILFNDIINVALSTTDVDTRIMALNAFQALLSGERDERTKNYPRSKWVKLVYPLISPAMDIRVRKVALKALSLIHENPEHWATLIIPTFSDADEYLRAFAAGIATSGSTTSEQVIEKLWSLLKDPSARVRQTSAQAIIASEKFADKDIPFLIDLGFGSLVAVGEDSVHTLQDSLLILAQKARSNKSASLVYEKIIELLESKLEDAINSEWFYYQRRMRPNPKLAKRVSTLFNKPDPAVRFRAISLWRLVRQKSDTFKELYPLLTDEDSTVRATVVMCLQDTDLKPNIINKLVEGINHPEPQVARASARSLYKVIEPELRQDIMNRLVRILNNAPKNVYAYDLLLTFGGVLHQEYYDIPF